VIGRKPMHELKLQKVRKMYTLYTRKHTLLADSIQVEPHSSLPDWNNIGFSIRRHDGIMAQGL